MTVYQQAGLQINAHDSAPVELLAPLRQAGYTRVELLLNALRKDPPLAPPTRAYVDRLKREAGFQAVYGVVWAGKISGDDSTTDDPIPFARFCQSERQRLNLNGFIINAEDRVEELDGQPPGLKFSRVFLDTYRLFFPRLPLYLNTYIGCGGIDLPAWEKAGARLIVQTHHEGHTFEWGVPGYVAWAQKYGWRSKDKIKPQFAVYKGEGGVRADVDAQVASAKAVGTIGFSAYYAEGSFDEPEQMTDLYAKAKAAGAVK